MLSVNLIFMKKYFVNNLFFKSPDCFLLQSTLISSLQKNIFVRTGDFTQPFSC